MDRPARLPIDCPRCENRGVVPLDDDRTIACPLCNNWWTLCLEGVPTFVPIIRPYRVVSSPACGQLPPVRRYLRATRATITRRCSAATPTLRRGWLAAIRWARRTSRCRGASLSCATHMVRQETGRSLRTQPDRPLAPIDTHPMARSSIPVQQSLLRG